MKKANSKRLEQLIADIDKAKAVIENDPTIKQLRELKEKFENEEVESLRKIRSMYEELENIKDDEQQDWDNKSEKWQEGEKGQEAQDKISELENIMSEMESAAQTFEELNLDSFFESLEEAEENITEQRDALESFLNDL